MWLGTENLPANFAVSWGFSLTFKFTYNFSLQLLIKNKLFWLTSKGVWHYWQHKLEKMKVGQEKKDLLMWIDVSYYLLWYQTSNWVVDLFPMLWSCLSHTTVLFIITGHCAVLMIGFRFIYFYILSTNDWTWIFFLNLCNANDWICFLF